MLWLELPSFSITRAQPRALISSPCLVHSSVSTKEGKDLADVWKAAFIEASAKHHEVGARVWCGAPVDRGHWAVQSEYLSCTHNPTLLVCMMWSHLLQCAPPPPLPSPADSEGDIPHGPHCH